MGTRQERVVELIPVHNKHMDVTNTHITPLKYRAMHGFCNLVTEFHPALQELEGLKQEIAALSCTFAGVRVTEADYDDVSSGFCHVCLAQYISLHMSLWSDIARQTLHG